MQLRIVDKNGAELFSANGKEISAMYNGEYSEGDKICISASGTEFLKLCLDKTLKEAIIFNPQGTFEYEIPRDKLRDMYSPEAFSGNVHPIRVSEPMEEEIYALRNIALNPYDVRGQKRYFPHAKANLVTREAPSFFGAMP